VEVFQVLSIIGVGLPRARRQTNSNRARLACFQYLVAVVEQLLVLDILVELHVAGEAYLVAALGRAVAEGHAD
jgi:hypothetical protein